MKQYFIIADDIHGNGRLYAVAAIGCTIPADCECRGFPVDSDGAQVYDYMTEQNASVALSDCTLSEYAQHAIEANYNLQNKYGGYAVYIAGAGALAYDALEEYEIFRSALCSQYGRYPDEEEFNDYVESMEYGKDYFPVYIIKDYN